MTRRVLIYSALWFVAVFLLTLAFLTLNQPSTVAVDATPAGCSVPKHFSTINRSPRNMA